MQNVSVNLISEFFSTRDKAQNRKIYRNENGITQFRRMQIFIRHIEK